MSADFNFNFNVTVDVPQLLDLLAVLGGSTIADALNDLKMSLNNQEMLMSDFGAKLDKLEETLTAFDAREAKEDETAALSAAEIERLNAEVATLKATIEAGKATPEEQARFDALIERIAQSNLPDEVLPEGGGEPPVPPEGGGEPAAPEEPTAPAA